MKKYRFLLIASLSILLCLQGCKVNRQFMFQVPEDYHYSELKLDSSIGSYVICPGDEISFELYTNQGATIIEFSTGSKGDLSRNPANNLIIDTEGKCEFPMIGVHHISGFTPSQAEDYLEQQFAIHFVDPYILVKVLNRRVMLFSGLGNGKILTLGNNNISLIEALAQAGGINDYSRADQIRLIRNSGGSNQEVYHIDVSTISGASFARMPVKSGDIIYIEAEKRLGQRALARVTPWFSVLGILSSSLVIINLLTR